MFKFRVRPTILSSLATTLLLFSCSKDPSAPGPSADTGYKPQLLEAAGTIYSGNYYPLTTGMTWNNNGTETTRMKIHMSMTMGSITIDTTMYDTTAFTSTLTSKVLSQQTMLIENLNVSVVPMQTVTNLTNADTSTSSNATSYYLVTDSAIYSVGCVMENDSTNDTILTYPQILLKQPLVVGDHWESDSLPFAMQNLSVDLNDLVVHSTTYVLGKTNITVNGQSFDAVKLEEVFNESGTIVDSSDTIKFSAEGIITIYLVKDTGEVKITQNNDMVMTSNGTSPKMDITTTAIVENNLVSFSTTGNGLPLAKTAATSNVPDPTLVKAKNVGNHAEDLLQKHRPAILKALANVKPFLL